MNIEAIVFNPIEENTYIIWDESKECIIVDAGNSTPSEDAVLRDFISQHSLKPVMAVNTHGHFDHALGVEFVRSHYGVPFALSSRDMPLLESVGEGSVVYGMRIGAMPSSFDIDLAATSEIKFGNSTLQVIQTPGHTAGHVALFDERGRALITGDTIFRESIGRTDLPGGDYVALMGSIIERIIPLGDDVEIYAGHGAKSSIGHETLYNPFVVEVISGEFKY